MFNRKKNKITIKPVVGQKVVDLNTQLPYYLSVLKYGEIRERYRHLEKPAICVLDNGMYDEHEDIKDSIIGQHDFTGYDFKFKGLHGTHVAGHITGQSYGLSDNTPILNYRVLSPDGGVVSDLVKAIYKAKEDGYSILNLSLGSDYPDDKLEKALRDFTSIDGNFVIIASGNDGMDTDYPAAYAKTVPGVISVAAADTLEDGSKSLANFSSRGAVTVAYQGVDVISAGAFWEGVHKYMIMSGTSMACPGVAVLIALAKAIYPEFRLKHFHKITEKSVEVINESDNPFDVGYGFLNPELFLKNVEALNEEVSIEEGETTTAVECEKGKEVWKKIKRFLERFLFRHLR